MCRVVLLACCLAVAATAALTVPIVMPATIPTAAPVPKGAIAAPKSKEVEEEEKKAARYKALREGYEGLRDSLPMGAERSELERDMNLARGIARRLLDLEQIADPYERFMRRKTWETCEKREVTDTPRRKELFEIYSYELDPMAGTTLRSKNIEAEKVAHYKVLRRSYDSLLDTLPRGPERFRLQDDMKLASEVAQERLDIEKSGHPVLKTFRLEKWEAGSKREVMRTPRLKELFELYSYELSQKK